MAFVIRSYGSRGETAFRHGVRDVFERGFFVPRTAYVFALREIEHELDRFIWLDVAKERIIQLAHLIESFHEHIRVGDFTGQQVMQRLFGALIVARFDQRFVRLTRPGFSGDICPQVADHVTAFLNVCRRPAAPLAVQEVRSAALDLEQWGIVYRGFLELTGMLCDQLANHLKVAELLNRNVLKHIADAGILDVEGPAFYSRDFGEFILPYDEVRQASSPDEALLDFLQSTYEAAATLAHWDRAELERPAVP